MSRPEKERTAALGGGVIASYKTNGYMILIAEREIFEGDHEVAVIPPQEINLNPKAIQKLQELITGPDEMESTDDA